MKEAPLVPNEADRIAALERYGILDSHSETIFDCITQAAAEICETPIALISLVDPDRQWFKSRVGLDAQETLRQYAFCSHTFQNPQEIMEVEDATLDERFHDNPLVTDNPNIRFYAGKPLVTPDGHALGTLCVIDRKAKILTNAQRRSLNHLAEAAMILIEERYKSPISVIGKAIEENNPHGILVTTTTDSGFQITYCNQRYESITGFKKSEILGGSDDFLYGLETNKAAIAQIQKAVSRGEKHTTVLKLYRKNGTIFWNELILIPIKNTKGHVTHYLSVHQDVSEQHMAQEELRISHASLKNIVAAHAQANILLQQEVEQRRRTESKFRQFIESAPDAIIIVDNSGTIEVVNHRAEMMFEFHRDELIGENIQLLIPKLSAIPQSSHLEQTLQLPATGPVGQTLELTALNKSGHKIPVEIKLSRVRDQNNPLISAAIRDISRRLQMEDQSRELQNDLAHVARLSTMSQMATGLAHELNQPLTAITQNADAALITLKDYKDLDPELTEYIQDIESEALRAGEIIRSLRRLISKNSTTPSEINLNALILQTVQLMTPDARTNNITIKANSSPIPNPIGDRVQIAQVLVNLIRNSVEAIALSDCTHKTITVSTNHDELFVTVSVHDTGPGFRLLTDAFEAFETSKNEGLGIGLSISTTIIEKHGGKLWRDADITIGATVLFTLPINSAP